MGCPPGAAFLAWRAMVLAPLERRSRGLAPRGRRVTAARVDEHVSDSAELTGSGLLRTLRPR